ncbi:unnamed protein product [Hymenolepis diminuta]|uniref:Uncharacterized protein n=1 Tax=Hymenolepis diminuta TaxID=6216 RepID=A0A564XW24_HYMDI|nr:unnamed protein product [Hymenolepis diminuta]
MYSGFNNYTDFDQPPTHFCHCECCHVAVKVPCCHANTNSSNHSHLTRQNFINGPQIRSNIRFVEVTKTKGEPLIWSRKQ